MVTLHLRITGRVQGVGYRDALSREAEKLGVTGWVRNRRDGSVEAVVQGLQTAVDGVIAFARRGPPAARVTDVSLGPATPQDQRPYAYFEIRPSV
jgi:acylphosphatase